MPMTFPRLCLALLLVCALFGCAQLVRVTDRDVVAAIAEKQRQGLGMQGPRELAPADGSVRPPGREAYDRSPSPTPEPPPPEFTNETEPRQTDPIAAALEAAERHEAGEAPDEPPSRFRERVFTLTDALAYAQQHRREYQNTKEDLYLVALALTLERHLWTPQFAGSLRTVYGNFGEDRNFDQAMRFVADLSAAQRLPYGGRFTAQAISTLIRDVGQSITAAEGSEAVLGLEVPLLRGAGHVQREQLIQLERSLTYAVRSFERFRRAQLVEVAGAYFDLLSSKQGVLDAQTSLRDARLDYVRARALEEQDTGESITLPLDTRRAQQRLLSEENRLAQLREAFRFATDRFKLQIGMPVDERIGLDDLEDIELIQEAIADGRYPLLRRPTAVDLSDLALEVALARRLDLLSARDQIEDARRGVNLARNALLPDLDWISSLRFDTDPNHYRMARLHYNRANWRTEMILSLDDRFREKNDYRASLIDLRRAQRTAEDVAERVRVDVRRARSLILLQEQVIQIQIANVAVAEFRRAYARQRFNDGDLGNRDVVEAENEWTDARNALNAARTDAWSALLAFRLATETLRVDEQGVQYDDAGLW